MGLRFDPQQGLIIVHAELWGPKGSGVLRLALDTGATSTLVNAGLLVAIGYDPALTQDRVQITTGSGIEFVPRIILDRIMALEHRVRTFRYCATPCRPVRASMVSWGWTSFVDRA